MTKIGLLKASEVGERVVAIVKFGPPSANDGLRPGEYYRVTVDPRRFSPCGRFIRFGDHPGDELAGWQNADTIHVVSILAPWPDHIEMLELRWFNSPALMSA